MGSLRGRRRIMPRADTILLNILDDFSDTHFVERGEEKPLHRNGRDMSGQGPNTVTGNA